VGRLDTVDLDAGGRVLALAFPDRLAIRRGSPGRFQLRTGTTAFVSATDPLGTEQFLVAADLDGRRKDSRIRLAAAIDGATVAEVFAPAPGETTRLVGGGTRRVERSERRPGGLPLQPRDRRPDPGEETAAGVLERVRRQGID